MLVLSRKVGEEVIIGDNIRIIISRVVGNRVAVGIEAPREVQVMRGELKQVRDEFSDGSTHFEIEFDDRECEPTGCAPRCAR